MVQLHDRPVVLHSGEGWLSEEDPAEELSALWFDGRRVEARKLRGHEEVDLKGAQGRSLEIDVTLEMGTAREAALHVLRSPDGVEETKISVCHHNHPKTNGTLKIDTSQSSLRTDLIGRPPESTPFKLIDDLRLRNLFDRSIIEEFAYNLQVVPQGNFPRRRVDKLFPLFARQCAVTRVFPYREDSRWVSLFAAGGARIVSMDVWQMHSVRTVFTTWKGASACARN